MAREVLRVGVLGPRPSNLDGHDPQNAKRVFIRNEICKILSEYQKRYKAIVGLTGLALGVEQDFAQVCIDCRIDYVTYLPYAEQENGWEKLGTNVLTHYQSLLNKSHQVLSVAEGKYSPKKIIAKKQKIIKDSDVMIFVDCGLFNPINYEPMYYAEKLNKTIIHV